MSDNERFDIIEEIQDEIVEQAQSADVPTPAPPMMDDESEIQTSEHSSCAVEDMILSSISKNINIMATAINKSEAQKHSERAKCVNWFIGIMVALVLLVVALIVADTFLGYTVRIEFLVSVILAILADVFAIVHTLVKYMTNVENYEAYSKLIDVLLTHINRK